jgi:signal transduction histidine kinase
MHEHLHKRAAIADRSHPIFHCRCTRGRQAWALHDNSATAGTDVHGQADLTMTSRGPSANFASQFPPLPARRVATGRAYPGVRRLDLDINIEALGKIEALPRLLNMICRTTGMGFAAVARVNSERWVACVVKDEIDFGLRPGSELVVGSTICREIFDHQQPVIIDHVAQDCLYSNHHTPAQYGFQSYISFPVFWRGGEFFGTLCAIDPRPARLNTPDVVEMFELFAELVGFHVDALEKLTRSQEALSEERRESVLREQFIAVLGHDLRNPLSALTAGLGLLRRTMLEPNTARVLSLMSQSVVRMGGLIDNLMDFASGRLGGGLSVRLVPVDLAPTLEHVINELRTAWPERVIEATLNLPGALTCDAARVGQLLSNLIANALTHGAEDKPIRVEAAMAGGDFELCVANGGTPIPPEVQSELFRPFFRHEIRASQNGLGLGLYIVAEIAKAHGGTISVRSTAQETRFTFRFKAHAPALSNG